MSKFWTCRFLTGLEALSLQGVPTSFYTETLVDADYMSLAGNAFSGPCCALFTLGALATLDLTHAEAFVHSS